MAKAKYTAKTADRHVLYQEAVQNVDFEVGMVERFYKKLRKKNPESLKEDFAGTFQFACEWVKRNKSYTAVAVDLDESVVDWGRTHNLAPLKDHQKERVQVVVDDVKNVDKPKVDIVVAFNFSYWIFEERPSLREYFVNCYRSLKPDGLLIMDAFGGEAAHSEIEEPRKCDGFTYIWEHHKFEPITHHMECRIHFEFKDGTKMRNAFKYAWRLWSPPEIRELLEEAGFKDIRFYFEGTDGKTGDGNGVFRETKKGEPAETWIAYIVALK